MCALMLNFAFIVEMFIMVRKLLRDIKIIRYWQGAFPTTFSILKGVYETKLCLKPQLSNGSSKWNREKIITSMKV